MKRCSASFHRPRPRTSRLNLPRTAARVALLVFAPLEVNGLRPRRVKKSFRLLIRTVGRDILYNNGNPEGLMSSTTIPKKTDLGWVVDVPGEIARELGVAEGSIALLHAKDGRLEVEILPPPSMELIESVRRLSKKYK